MATNVLFATLIGEEDFHVQEEQVTCQRRLLTLAALSWHVQRFRVAWQLEQRLKAVDPLSEEGVCVFAVRECASSGGRLSTVLVGGRLLQNHATIRHAQADIFPRDHFSF